MRYTLQNAKSEVLIDNDDLTSIAEFLGVKPAYLYVRLSAGKGQFAQGKGQAKHVVTDNRRRSTDEGTRGPRSVEWHYVAMYLEQETDMEFQPAQEVQMEDIISQTGLARSTITQRFASYQDVTAKYSRAPKAYRYDRVVFRRVPAESMAQFISAKEPRRKAA